jgi:hypothetical protein
MENLRLTLRKTMMGCGIYEAGDPEKRYQLLFITESGRALAVNNRCITDDDLMQVYSWGRLDEREEIAHAKDTVVSGPPPSFCEEDTEDWGRYPDSDFGER